MARLLQALNSQLLRESAALDWTQGTGHREVAAAAAAPQRGAVLHGRYARLMAATAASSGRTLAQLSSQDPVTGTSAASEGQHGQIPGMGHVDPTTAAAEAAMSRLGDTHPVQSPAPHLQADDVDMASALSANTHQTSFGPAMLASSAAQTTPAQGAPTFTQTGGASYSSDQAEPAAAGQDTGLPSVSMPSTEDTGATQHASCSCERMPWALEAGAAHDEPMASASLPAAGPALHATPCERPQQRTEFGAAHDEATGMTDVEGQTRAAVHAGSGPQGMPLAEAPGAAHPDALASASQDEATVSMAEPEAEDPGQARFRSAELAARALLLEAGAQAGSEALATLATILQVIADTHHHMLSLQACLDSFY